MVLVRGLVFCVHIEMCWLQQSSGGGAGGSGYGGGYIIISRGNSLTLQIALSVIRLVRPSVRRSGRLKCF